jgi:Ca-activated chloride channel homolog
MLRIIVRLLTLALVTTTVLMGQQTLYTLKVDVPLVSVDVLVTDAFGKIVNDLSAADFQVLENGISQQIRYFSPVSSPYNILLLFDRSGSTQHKWPFMQKAVAGFVASLRPQDRIAIDCFDFEIETLTSWSDKRDKAIEALERLTTPKATGVTAFYQALETALRRQFKDVVGRRALVVLTDGRDTSLYKGILARNRMLSTDEDRPFQRTLRLAGDQRIPIYFVAMNTDLNFEPNLSGGDEYRNLQVIFPKSSIADAYLNGVRSRMQQLAERSGGRMLYPRRMEDIVPLYEGIGRELGTSYSLGYTPADERTDGSLRRIEIRTSDPALRLTQSRTAYYAK